MKSICLGGELSGFTVQTHAEGPEDLERVVEEGEPVVLVCHGAPITSEKVLDPDVLRHNVHAVLITHRADPASPLELNQTRNGLRGKCQRVFGLTRGWEALDRLTRERVLNFVTSDRPLPQDPDVQALLGYHSPLTRLAMRVSLEIALRELDSGSRLRTPGGNMSSALLVKPALTIGENEPSLNAMAHGIRSGLDSSREALSESVSQVLSQFRK